MTKETIEKEERSVRGGGGRQRDRNKREKCEDRVQLFCSADTVVEC